MLKRGNKMKKMKKSRIAMLMAFVLCIGMIPVHVANASGNDSQPRIESVVFHDDGKTIKEYDEISFTVKTNLSENEISSVMAGVSSDAYGFATMASFEEVDSHTYLVTTEINQFVGQANKATIYIYDNNWKQASYVLEDISLNVEANVADVSAEFTVDKDTVVIDEADIVESGTGTLYQETVEVTLTVQGIYDDTYSTAYVEYKYGDAWGSQLPLYFDDMSSTDTTTVYKGELRFDQFLQDDKCVLGDVYLRHKENSRRELVQSAGKTIQLSKGFEDKEAPQFIDVSIDRQGETITDGKILITLRATDNVGIGTGSEYNYVSLLLGSPIPDMEEESYFVLKYQGDNVYTAEIDLSQKWFYPCEWFINFLTIYDTVGNKTQVDFGKESPHYFYIENEGRCEKQVFSGLTVHLMDNKGKEITSITKNAERRATIGDVLGAEYLGGSKTNLGKFLGWSTEKGGKTLDKDTQFLTKYDAEETTSVTLYEVYENEWMDEIPEVTIVEDKKTEETITQETTKVVQDILNENVSESVVDEKTAENVSVAISKGQTVTAEIVVKEIKQEEIAQIDKEVIEDIEDKVTSVLGEDAKVQYLDVAIVLKADDKELGTLNKLEEEITITVAIPEELKAEGRTYKVIRNHNGEVTVLDTVLNEDGTISFKTDRFSTYALAYADGEGTGMNPNPGNTSSEGGNTPSEGGNTSSEGNTNPSVEENKAAKAPQTGDNRSVMMYVIICMVTFATIVVACKKKLNEEN